MREGTPFVVRGCGRSKMMSWAPEVMDRVAREAEPLPGVQARQTLQACASMLQHGVNGSMQRHAWSAGAALERSCPALCMMQRLHV